MSHFETSSAESQPILTREVVRVLAIEAGFTEAGLVQLPHAAEVRDAARFENWVGSGRSGTMDYLKRTEEIQSGEGGRLIRSSVGVPFPWARSLLLTRWTPHDASLISQSSVADLSMWA